MLRFLPAHAERFMRQVLAAACLVLLGATAGTTREQIPAEERWLAYDARLPGCDAPEVIERLRSRFAEKEATYWTSSLQIASVNRIRPVAFRPNGLDLIPRRYCRGEARLNNHKVSTVYYSIIEDAGMAGYSYGLHFCLAGYDRNWANAPGCKMARP